MRTCADACGCGATVFAEMAVEAHARGRSVSQHLTHLYDTYGHFISRQVCVLILLYVCPHTPICVSSYSFVFPYARIDVSSYTPIYLSSYSYMCVLILRCTLCPHTTMRHRILICVCPHTRIYMSSYCNTLLYTATHSYRPSLHLPGYVTVSSYCNTLLFTATHSYRPSLHLPGYVPVSSYSYMCPQYS
jgi:hypothetical protein